MEKDPNDEKKQNSENDSKEKKDKKKRHRRKNEEIKTQERQFKCQDCEKCYSSAPALTNHRKAKHLNNINDPKNKDHNNIIFDNENPTSLAYIKYINFFNDEKRKILLSEKESNEEIISLEKITNFFKSAIDLCYKDNINGENKINLEEYPLYNIIKENWNKENPDIKQDSYSEYNFLKNKTNNTDNKNNIIYNKNLSLIKIRSPCIDDLFYLYLKEFSKISNENYFKLMVQFVFLFRENINIQKYEAVPENIKTETKKEFTQLFNAEEVPELCNSFFSDYLEENDFFGLGDIREEIIELLQHFCFWLYNKKYSPSHLALSN